jgi:hypothetical protein
MGMIILILEAIELAAAPDSWVDLAMRKNVPTNNIPKESIGQNPGVCMVSNFKM